VIRTVWRASGTPRRRSGFGGFHPATEVFEDALPVALALNLACERAIEHRLHADLPDDVPHLEPQREAKRAEFGRNYLLAVTILIGPNRSTTIGLPLASLPCTP
jgi:hypothetical protein